MDIAFAQNTWKLKIKKVSVTVDIDGMVSVSSVGRSEPFVINEPGEYEIEGTSIFGYADEGGAKVYAVQGDEVRVLYLGDLPGKLGEKLIDELDSVDAVIVGVAVADVKLLTETIEKIEPSYVLPYGEETKVAALVKNYEHGSKQMPKLSLSRATVNDETTEVVILGS